ncbi:MAG TPA: helix-turn-helix domain-containing protein [Candidatus Nitrosotalea sp.]|nr:helix-turn-helix domain-containing protein [Candidatus Nitrosotalea sp.]
MPESPNLSTVVQEVLDSLMAERPLSDTLALVVRRVAELGGFNQCGVMLPDPDSRRIRLVAGFGFKPDYADRLHALGLYTLMPGPLAGGPTSHAFENNRLVVVPDVADDPSFSPWHPLSVAEGYRSLVSAPLRVRGDVIGVLNGYSDRIRRPTDSELEAIQTLADQAALAVRLAALLADQQTTIDQLTELNGRLERQRSTLQRSEQIHHRLTSAVLGGSGLEGVATTLAGLLGRPVAIWDTGGYQVCSAPARIREGSESDVARPRLGDLHRFGSRTADSGRTLVAPAAEGAPALVVAEVSVGSELVGYVSVEESGVPVEDLDLMAVEHGATVVALITARERVARETEERLHADFLHDLLNGRYGSAERIVERAQHYGLELYATHRILVMDLDDWGGYQRSRALNEQDSGLLRARIVRLMADTAQRCLPGSLQASLSDTLTCVSPGDDGRALEERMHHTVAMVQAQISRIAPALTVSAGIGSVARTPDDLAESYRSATRCLHLIRQLERYSQCLCSDNLGLLLLVAETRRPADLVRFAERILGVLVEPGTREGPLLDTLEAMLDTGRDPKRCAARLHVHPNTVRNRMQRIKRLTGTDLDRPETLLEVTLAMLVLRLLR